MHSHARRDQRSLIFIRPACKAKLMELIQDPLLPGVASQDQNSCSTHHTCAVSPGELRWLPRDVQYPPCRLLLSRVDQEQLRWGVQASNRAAKYDDSPTWQAHRDMIKPWRWTDIWEASCCQLPPLGTVFTDIHCVGVTGAQPERTALCQSTIHE